MPFKPESKKTALVPSGEGNHLFVILTDANNINMHLMVPVCTIRLNRYYDDTCLLKAEDNEHPFIKQDSYVDYKNIQERVTNHIVRCVAEKSYIEKESISSALHKRICEGIGSSPHTKKWAKEHYKNWPK